MFKNVKRFFAKLGPGVITGASDDDPSGIATYSIAGAAFGLALNWLTLFLYPLMVATQEMCGRIGLVTGQGLAGVLRLHYAKPFMYAAVLLLLVANVINIGADIGAMAASANMIIPIPFVAWAVLFTILIITLEISLPYKSYSKVLKWLAAVLVVYILTAFVVQPDWIKVVGSLFRPSIEFNTGFLAAIVAFAGTTISPYLFFWQASEEVEEEVEKHEIIAPGRGKPKLLRGSLSNLRFDTAIGMFWSNLATFFIIVTTYATLHLSGKTSINSAQEAASAIEPLVRAFPFAGFLAKLFFALGVVGLGLLAVPVLAGSAAYALSESFGWREGLYLKFKRAHGFYGVIIVATLIGLLINFLGINPIEMLFITAVINGLIAPPLILLILFIGNNKNVLGQRTNGALSNIFGTTTLIVMSVASLFLLGSYFFG